MTLSTAVIRQTKPKGPHTYNERGPDEYKAYAERVMDIVDNMSPEYRELVHEVGFIVVWKLRHLSPSAIRAALEKNHTRIRAEYELKELGL